MGQPPPKGQVVGLFLCIVNSEGNIVLKGDDGTIVLHLSVEDAGYFAVGQSYSFAATTP